MNGFFWRDDWVMFENSEGAKTIKSSGDHLLIDLNEKKWFDDLKK
jgi:hypothetical protein